MFHSLALHPWAGNFIAVRIHVRAAPKQKQGKSKAKQSKAKQNNVPKKTKGKKATRPNERLFQDLATVKAPKSLDMTVTMPHWQLLVDEWTNMKFSSHHETKSGMIEPTCVKMSKLADIAGDIAYLRQDNTQEKI